MEMTVTSSSLLAILPETLLLILAGFVLLLDVVWKKRPVNFLDWLTVFGLSLVALVTLFFARPAEQPELIFGGMLRFDWPAFVLRFVFLFAGIITILVGMDPQKDDRGDVLGLLVFTIFGMSLMAASANIVMLYLAMETTSLPLYILAGQRIREAKSVEAGIKYFLYGSICSAVMLYGFSLLWGWSGSTGLAEIATNLVNSRQTLTSAMALVLVTVGFGFKVSVAPFHFWAPDVYDGAPTPIAGYLSTASKAAGFAVLVRFVAAVFPAIAWMWVPLVGVLAGISMILGNWVALQQSNIKRLLAYSSIAQAGYILVGVAANNTLGFNGVVYYLFSYLLTNLAVFGVVWMVEKQTGSLDLESFSGLAARSPFGAVVMLAGLLSLAGIPPLSGFPAKLMVFGAAIQSGLDGQGWLIGLAVLGFLTSVVGLYYYLTVIRLMYSPSGDANRIAASTPWKVGVGLCLAGMIALGVIIAPLYGWGLAAANAWLH